MMLRSCVLVTLVFGALCSAVRAQQVKQCLCSEITPCKDAHLNALEPCMDSCQHHLASMGGNYQQLKTCLKQRQNLLTSAISCTESQFSNACANSPGQMVPKRYPETLQIATISEINRMINKMGLSGQAKGLMDAGKKIFGCMKTCMAKKSGNCDKNLKCGLALPPDNVVVQNVKKCAISSGFNTANAQALCQCGAAAGVKALQGDICSKVIIS